MYRVWITWQPFHLDIFQFVLAATHESYWMASFDCHTTHSLQIFATNDTLFLS